MEGIEHSSKVHWCARNDGIWLQRGYFRWVHKAMAVHCYSMHDNVLWRCGQKFWRWASPWFNRGRFLSAVGPFGGNGLVWDAGLYWLFEMDLEELPNYFSWADKREVKVPTVTMEGKADDQLWFCHLCFGITGCKNAVIVYEASLFLVKISKEDYTKPLEYIIICVMSS